MRDSQRDNFMSRLVDLVSLGCLLASRVRRESIRN
jgi:hypothetical protein